MKTLKLRKAIISLVATISLLTLAPISANAEWRQSSTGQWWYEKNGSYYSNGWFKVGNDWYAFNQSGYMQTGWLESNGDWYYCSPSTGAMLHNTYIGEYYLDSTGRWSTPPTNDPRSHRITSVTSSGDGEFQRNLQKNSK